MFPLFPTSAGTPLLGTTVARLRPSLGGAETARRGGGECPDGLFRNAPIRTLCVTYRQRPAFMGGSGNDGSGRLSIRWSLRTIGPKGTTTSPASFWNGLARTTGTGSIVSGIRAGCRWAIFWALLYWSWGELGSYANAVYFSLASFTTIGASGLTLSPGHRIVGATEAAVGMLIFGWTTALLFEVIQATRGKRKVT